MFRSATRFTNGHTFCGPHLNAQANTGQHTYFRANGRGHCRADRYAHQSADKHRDAYPGTNPQAGGYGNFDSRAFWGVPRRAAAQSGRRMFLRKFLYFNS